MFISSKPGAATSTVVKNYHISVPINLCGLVIGKRGETKKRLETDAGCSIKIVEGTATSMDSVTLEGQHEAVDSAREMIVKLIAGVAFTRLSKMVEQSKRVNGWRCEDVSQPLEKNVNHHAIAAPPKTTPNLCAKFVCHALPMIPSGSLSGGALADAPRAKPVSIATQRARTFTMRVR